MRSSRVGEWSAGCYFTRKSALLCSSTAQIFMLPHALLRLISTTSACSNFSARRADSIRAFDHTALIEDQEYSPLRPLVDWLDYNGYTMVTKPTKEFTDAMGRRKLKGNMDIELAIDVMEMAQSLDHIVLFSGDGDFRRLVEAVQRKGVRVTVVSTIRSTPPMVADELRRQADVFIELQDLAPQIMRAHNGGTHHREPQQQYSDSDA